MFYAWRLIKWKLILNTNTFCVDNAFQNVFFVPVISLPPLPVISPLKTPYEVYIPLINRVRSPYRKLWTKFFSLFYGPSGKHTVTGHKKRGENEDP